MSAISGVPKTSLRLGGLLEEPTELSKTVRPLVRDHDREVTEIEVSEVWRMGPGPGDQAGAPSEVKSGGPHTVLPAVV